MAIRALLLAVLAACTSAARLAVTIPPGALLPNPATLPPSTHAVLIGAPGVRYDVPLRKDSSFIFPDLEEASYLLAIHTRDYHFPPLRVDVSKAADGSGQQVQAWQTFRGNEWSNKGPHYGTGKRELAIQVQPNAQKNFYQERGGFSLISFVKSPMILMALVSVAFIFGIPYMMDNMDPEMKAEFDEMQSKGPLSGQQSAANQLQNFDLAGFLAGKGTGADSGSGGGRKR